MLNKKLVDNYSYFVGKLKTSPSLKGWFFELMVNLTALRRFTRVVGFL